MNQKNDTLTIIKKLLNERGWSVYHLAKKSGIPYSSLNNIFIRNTEPTIPTLRKIYSGFSISMSEFFLDDDSIDTTSQANAIIVESNDEIEVLEIYRKLNKKDAAKFLTYAKGFAQIPLIK